MSATAPAVDLRTALEAHAAECRKALADMRPRPDLPEDLRARLRTEHANLAGADLAGAYLADADLADANLAGANLARANLAGAKGIVDVVSITRIGSRQATLTATKAEDGAVRVMTGCFAGTLDEFESAAARTHGDNEHGKAYAAAAALIRLRLCGGAK